MKKIIHLDCTLRDGGYYTNWIFSKNLINDYLTSMNDIKIDYVEIGFRFLDNKKKGALAYTKESFLKKLKIPKKLNLGVMINASDFLNKSRKPDLLIKKNFLIQKKSKIKLIRIACHFKEIFQIKILVDTLKNLGYEIAINVMQISERSHEEILNVADKIKKLNVDVLYFADSLGSLEPKKIKKIISTIKKKWKGEIGIHTHDNIGKALDNSLTALNNGVTWVDTTVLGMGRGPGNTKTELAILEFNKLKNEYNHNNIKLLELIDKWFTPLKIKYNWGSNTFYYLAGMKSIHPSYIQEMIGDPTFSNKKILENLDYLEKNGGKSFNKSFINTEYLFYGKDEGQWLPEKILKGKNVLLLGPGGSVKIYEKKIVQLIKKYNFYVISLNFQKSISSKFIKCHLICNPIRLLFDLRMNKKIQKPIISPLNRVNKIIKKSINKKLILNYGLEIKKDTFEFGIKKCVIPNSLALSYALAVSNSGKASKIFLAGFDGYQNNNPKKFLVDETLNLYKKNKKNIKIFSLTPTLYNLKKI